tara:strand:+ start:1601 stop:2332 length:732 start_codon:yes stop_codon:yes gene_type:complete
MLNEKRNKNEIVNLYYGDNPRVLFPDAQLSSELEILGLNPNDYIYDLNSEQIRNIDSLYAELLLMESNALKQQVAYLKQTLYGSDAYDFMLSPPEHDKLGNPKNRDTLYYVKKIGKVKDGFEKDKENILKLARHLSQGDSIQPIRTEDLMATYSTHNKHVSPNDEVVKKLFNSDITILEWERAMILKDFLYFQLTIDEDFPNVKNIYIQEVMNKKHTYGQSIVYNHNTKSYCVNGEWIKEQEI